MNIPNIVAELTDEERYLTPSEFVRKYRWSYKMVLRLTKTKGFPAFKMNDSTNRYVIDVMGVPAWVETQRKKPKPYR